LHWIHFDDQMGLFSVDKNKRRRRVTVRKGEVILYRFPRCLFRGDYSQVGWGGSFTAAPRTTADPRGLEEYAGVKAPLTAEQAGDTD
jgi:hypothetical protein